MLRCNMGRIIQDHPAQRKSFLLHCSNLEGTF